MKAKELHKLLQPFLLRRTKSEVGVMLLFIPKLYPIHLVVKVRF